jgi:hypothetical protein
VAFGVARQFLRERNQVLPLERRNSTSGVHLGSIMIAHTVVIGNLYYNLRPMKRALVAAMLGAAAGERIK